MLRSVGMTTARLMYCSRCGGAFRPGAGPVTVYVNGAPACPECGGTGFVAATCRWGGTVFRWSSDGDTSCPLCTHDPYWAP